MAPQMHDSALADPARYGGPFLNPEGAGVEQVQEFLDTMLEEGRAKLKLADDIDQLRALLKEKATGGSMEPLYAQVPESLRGRVELVYDTAHRPSFRFFEPLMYRSPAFEREAHTVSLSAAPTAQPFVYGSPVLPSPHRLDVRVPFDSPLWDELFAARLAPVDVDALAAGLGVTDLGAFSAFFQGAAPEPYAQVAPDTVRVRYFNHATVLVETENTAVLLDPLIGYADDGHEHFTVADLPPCIDAVVISHFHSDHFSLETLLQLRSRVGVILVPRASGGSLPDPSLKTMLQALGFERVQELGELETHHVAERVDVVALPFMGEHADLDIRTKIVPMVRALGRSFMFATDTAPVEPALYDNVSYVIDRLDALFIGLECVGAPLKWLYGPLLDEPLSRRHDTERRLKGSDAAMADRLAEQLGAEHVFAYAMGLEPWLKHLTGSEYDADAEPVRQAALLAELAGRRGVTAELLYRQAERTWPAA